MATAPQVLTRTAFKGIAKNLASPAGLYRAAPSGSSLLNVDIKQNVIAMALDSNTGKGTQPLDPIMLRSNRAQAPREIIPQPALKQLRQVIEDNRVSTVLVSWPTQDLPLDQRTEDQELSNRVLSTMNSVLRECPSEDMPSSSSCGSMTAPCIRATSRPFFMLDGRGRRLASMCLVKSSSDSQSNDVCEPNPSDPSYYFEDRVSVQVENMKYMHSSNSDGQIIHESAGVWLKEYSRYVRNEAERAA